MIYKNVKKTHSFHNKHIYINESLFCSFVKFYLVHVAKVCFVFKNYLYACISVYMHKTLPTLGGMRKNNSKLNFTKNGWASYFLVVV